MTAALGRGHRDRTPARRAVRRASLILLLVALSMLAGAGCAQLGRAPLGGGIDGSRLRVPAIDVDAPISGVGLDGDGAMQVPDPGTVGWYRLGPRPGAPGPAVLVGHVDSRTGPAVFHRLRELRRGDRIVVGHDDGTASTFVVRRIEQHPKTALPVERIWPRTSTPLLRLVTCGGSFDRGRRSYRDNVIVYAAPVGA
jgi:sortase (surface protein transpeptidase)